MHRSGLAGNDEDDPMQEIWRRRAAEGLAHVASIEPLLAEHFKHPLAHAPGSHSSYSNTGFVVLSAVIAEATGKSYESYCREAVFAPLGIASARLHPDWRQLSGARGWIVAPADYLAFLDVFDPKHPFLGDRVKAWIVAAETRWDKDYRGQFEGLGIVTAITPAGWQVMHSGILNFQGKGANGSADRGRDPQPRLSGTERHQRVPRDDAGDRGRPGAQRARPALHHVHDPLLKPQ